MRLLHTPYRRKVPEEDTPPEAPPEPAGSEKDKASARGSDKPDSDSQHVEGESVTDGASEGQPQPDPGPTEPVPARNWFNMVCYGLPNLMITQLSKV